MKFRAEEFPTYGTPAAGLAGMPAVRMSQAPAPAAEAMTGATDWTGIAGAGIQGGGQALSTLIQALARQQAMDARKATAAADNESVQTIARGRIDTSARDYDAGARVNAIRNLLQVAQASGALGRASLGNQQDATSGISSMIMNAHKGK